MAEGEPAARQRPPEGARAKLAAELRGAAASLTFLTRLPLGTLLAVDGSDVARSAPYFPLVGAGVGALVALVALVLAPAVGSLLAAVVALGAYAALTGALHFDAVADTADALGARSREDALRIMREPTIGAFGATVLFLDLALRTALIAMLVARPSFLNLLLVVGATSRLGPVLLLVALPYLRPAGGVGTALARGTVGRAAIAVAVALLLAIVGLGFAGVVLVAVSLLSLAVLGVTFRRWLGGVTGDLLGCSVEVLELVGLSTGLGLLSAGVVR